MPSIVTVSDAMNAVLIIHDVVPSHEYHVLIGAADLDFKFVFLLLSAYLFMLPCMLYIDSKMY